MFSPKTSPGFSPFQLRGFFAVRLLRVERWVFLSGFLVGSKKPLSVCAFDLAFAVALKSAGTYVIPVLSLMGETN